MLFFRFLAQALPSSTWAEGGLAMMFVGSLISGIAILWRQNVAERAEHSAALSAERAEHAKVIIDLVDSHRTERRADQAETKEIVDKLFHEYKTRLERLEKHQ